MKLKPGEQSILASFSSGPDAESCLTALKQAGYPEAQMDRVGNSGYKPDVYELRPAIAGKESSLANVTLDPAQLDDNSRILLAATPDASGMSGGSSDIKPFLVTVLTSKDRVQDAVDIIQQHGGRV